MLFSDTAAYRKLIKYEYLFILVYRKFHNLPLGPYNTAVFLSAVLIRIHTKQQENKHVAFD